MRYLTFLLLTTFIQAHTQSKDSLASELRTILVEQNLTGAAWSVVSDSLITTGACGLKNAVTGEKLREEDKIQIGSVTKTLIAAGILRMASLGLLNVDDPVGKYLPDLPFANPWRSVRPVLVRDLLNHTSGIEDARFWQVFSTKPQPDTPLGFVFTKNPDVLDARTKPGTRFSYSNMGYTMLGLIIERISGERYETYLDKNLLAPLGMKNSTFRFVTQEGPNANKNLAMGHFESGAIQASVPVYLRPAGQFTTTARDMALFAKFLMSDGSIDGKTIVDETFLRQMGRPTTTESNEQELFSGYQFGLSYRDRYGVIGYYHSGNIIGYRAVFYLFPEEQKAFFISFNEDSETANYQEFNAVFVKHLNIDRPEEQVAIGQLPDEIGKFEGYYELNPVRFRMFAYLDLMFNFVIVTAKDFALNVSSIQNERYQLLPMGGYFFRKEDRKRVSHVLYEKEGAMVISDGLATYQKISSAYLGAMWLNLGLGLIGFLLLLGRGLTLLFRKKLFRERQLLKYPFLSILGLLVPIPFLFNQPFLSLGDFTIANSLMALTTLTLAVSLLYSTIRILIRKWRGSNLWIDVIGIVFLFQWIVVLAYWGLIPFVLWH
ncbi:MAG: serine hydrolase domain-containing protein [Cyclobacteriaceae bacterium]